MTLFRKKGLYPTEGVTVETSIKNGKIECREHGSLTAIDCDSLQGKSCNGCFIYAALKNQSIDLEEFSLMDEENFSETSKTIN